MFLWFKSNINTTNKYECFIMSVGNLLKTLLSNYADALESIEAVAICDRDGLILASEGKGTTEDAVIGVISAVLDSYIDRIKNEFGTDENFFNITSAGENKFAYCSKGSNSIVTTIANPSATDMELRVFSEHVADKAEKIISGETNVSPSIPQIVHVLSKTKGGTLPTGEFSLKLIVTGDFQVGKTSLIKRFVENRFQESYISTIGVEISKKVINIQKDIEVNFMLWDIGGQIQSMAPYRARFYSGANAAFIAIDRTRPKTLEEGLERWHDDIKKSIPKNIPIIIIGTKSDLTDKIQVTEEDIKKHADEHGFHYILTSSKTGENVNDAFMYVGYKYLESI